MEMNCQGGVPTQVKRRRENLQNSMDHDDVEHLEGPTASPKDVNRYRNIKLMNGLVALLITIPGDPLDPDESLEGDDGDTFPDSIKASCTLRISVGDFSNPPDVPGLNECVAEMINKGSVKYPQKDNMDTLMRSFRGWYHRDIQCEATIFEAAEIPQDKFRGFLDRFSQLFSKPLMRRNVLRDVRNTIEKSLTDRSILLESWLLKNIAIPGHPVSKLSDEHLGTLREITDDRLYNEILKFRERHYCARRMTLCLRSRLPLDTMEEYVKEYFADIPSNDLPPEDLSQFNDVDPFDPQRFRRMYRIKSGLRSFDLSMIWVMPSLVRNYRSKPQGYLASLIKRKGEGSLLYYLQQNGWCKNIFVRREFTTLSDMCNNSMYSTFEILLYLTNKGLLNLKQVLDAVFSYINLVRRKGPQSRYFWEIQKIQEMNFRLAKKDMKYTYNEVMLGYPPTDFLTAAHLFFEYNPDAIKACLDLWTPDRMNMIVYEKVANGEIPMYDEWSNSDGTGTEISPDWIEHWRTIEPLPEFHFPVPNPFVVNDFTVKPTSNNRPRFPTKIHSDELLEVWWKPSIQTELHEDTYINCYLISSIPFASAANMAMLRIFHPLLLELLIDNWAMADEAGYSYYVNRNFKGLWIQVHGLNQNLPLLLQRIWKIVAQSSSRITEAMFNIKKEKILKNQQFDSPHVVVGMVTLSLKRKVHWSENDMRTALSNVAFLQFRDFVNKYTERLRSCFLVQGNMTKNEAIQTAKSCVEILNYQPLLPDTMPQRLELIFPRGVRNCRVKSFSTTDFRSCVENIYQFPDRSFKMATMIEFFRMIVQPMTGSHNASEIQVIDSNFGWDGYTLCGHHSYAATEHVLDDIDNKIEQFRESLRQRFNNASEEIMSATKQELTEKKRQECTFPDRLSEVNYNWRQITSDDYGFDRTERELQLIRNMSTAEFRAWLLKLTMPVTDRRMRKISVQVDGYNYADYNNIENSEMRNYSLQYLSARPRIIDETVNDYYITNIEAFKRDLEVISRDRSRW